MELNRNFSSLRKLVNDSGSAELRQLESRLLQSFANKLNSEAVTQKAINNEKETAKAIAEGAAMQQCAALEQEQHQLRHHAAKERATTLALFQQEQHHCRSIVAAHRQCGDVIEDMALNKPDTTTAKEKEASRLARSRAADAAAAHHQLTQQHRHLAAVARELEHTAADRVSEETWQMKELQENVTQEQASLRRLQEGRRLLKQAGQLVTQRNRQQELQELRAAVAEAELQEEERVKYLQIQQTRLQLQQEQLQDWHQQIRDKNAAAEREKRQDAEYTKILQEVQRLECNLEVLTAAARKRRLWQQREEMESLLQVRAAEREKKRLQAEQQNALDRQHQQVRSMLSAAEEQSLLLKFAPHLLPHLTPDLRLRLEGVGSMT